MSIIGTIVIGFIVGLIARFIKPGDDRMGLVLTTMIGIVGAFVGQFLGQVMGIYSSNEPAGFIGAIVGAVVVLALIKNFSGNRRKVA